MKGAWHRPPHTPVCYRIKFVLNCAALAQLPIGKARLVLKSSPSALLSTALARKQYILAQPSINPCKAIVHIYCCSTFRTYFLTMAWSGIKHLAFGIRHCRVSNHPKGGARYPTSGQLIVIYPTGDSVLIKILKLFLENINLAYNWNN